MKNLFIGLFCTAVLRCGAQTTDSFAQKAASYFHQAEIAAKDQKVWRAKLYGPMLLTDPQTRLTFANEPDSAGLLHPVAGIYEGYLPSAVMVANTAIDWEGKKWSVMLWPLPQDRDDRVNLMLHESFHRIQEGIGLPERSPTVDHLASLWGRVYFLLELQALRAALSKHVDQRSADLHAALVFRYQRKALFPATFGNERVLEMSEGLAEYTGMILGRPHANIPGHLNSQVDTAANRKSLIRSSAYLTGPLYGYLLYEKASGWTAKVDSDSDFPLLLAQAYHITLPRQPGKAALAHLAAAYGGGTIIPSEQHKEAKRMQTVKAYVDLFTKKPALTLELVHMSIEFNPNTLFDLGAYGTVYPTGQVSDNWGKLVVKGGGLLLKDWKAVTLSMEGFSHPDERSLTGQGWQLQLADGWHLEQGDALHYRLIQK